MTAAHVLFAAGGLLARFGHSPMSSDGGSELTGYTVPGAIRQASVDLAAAAGKSHPRLAAWLHGDVALDYVLTALGYEPDMYGPAGGRLLVDQEARRIWRLGLGLGWAVGLVDQAAALALADVAPSAEHEPTQVLAALLPA